VSIPIYIKKCPKCNEIKSFDEFNSNKRYFDGISYTCKQCQKQYRDDNKENINDSNKKYYYNNQEKINLYHRQYRTDNKENINDSNKKYRANNKDIISEKKKYHLKTDALYQLYNNRLTVEEEPRLADDGVSLEVRCKYCGKYFKPKTGEVRLRIQAIDGTKTGESNLYCSTSCKKSCGTYNKYKHLEGIKPDTSREVGPQLRKLVLERDNWKCQKCNSTSDLHCHHFEGIEINKIESADVDNCITLCKKCHNAIHKHCDMRRKKCK
jgi:hypothetical protein